MTQAEATERIKAYHQALPLHWEAIYCIDPAPVEQEHYWRFINYWEPRDPRRGDAWEVDGFFPYLQVDKATGEVKAVVEEG